MPLPAMSPMSENMIYLEGSFTNYHEGIAGGAILPGHIVVRASNGKKVVSPTQGSYGLLEVALECPLNGGTIATAYADTQFLPTVTPQSGDLLRLRIPSGQTIVKGDVMINNNAGQVIKTTGTPAQIVGIAEEAKTTSAATTILVRIS